MGYNVLVPCHMWRVATLPILSKSFTVIIAFGIHHTFGAFCWVFILNLSLSPYPSVPWFCMWQQRLHNAAIMLPILNALKTKATSSGLFSVLYSINHFGQQIRCCPDKSFSEPYKLHLFRRHNQKPLKVKILWRKIAQHSMWVLNTESSSWQLKRCTKMYKHAQNSWSLKSIPPY